MKYFFMDYENVHMNGFEGIEKLEENDIIYVIYSEQTKAFSLDILEQAQKQGVKIEAHKVSVGNKNALDFQLSSFLGYIIGKSEGSDSEYIIVSKDTGYDRVVEFWENRKKRICRLVNLFEESSSTPLTDDEIATLLGFSSKKDTFSLVEVEVATPEIGIFNREEIDENDDLYLFDGFSIDIDEILPIKATSNLKTTELVEEKDIKKENSTQITKEELLQVLSKEEYFDKILEIVNRFKTKREIHDALGSELKDTKKTGSLYRKLKPFLESKKKS